MTTTQKAQQVKDLLLKRKRAAQDDPPTADKGDAKPSDAKGQGVTLATLAMREVKPTAPKNKLRKRLWFQLLILCVVGAPFTLVAMGMLYGTTPPQADNGQSRDESASVVQSREERLTQENADLKVQVAALRQSLEGEPVPPGQKSGPKPGAVPSTVPNRRPPSAAHRVSRPIPVRSAVPRPQPRPRIIYRDRPAPKTQPVVEATAPAPRPQPIAQAAPKPAANFSLTQQSAFAPQPVQPVRPKPVRPIKISSSHPVRKPTSTKPIAKAPPPQGILVASLTGDLLQDNQVQSDSPTALYPAASGSPLGRGLIAPGTRAKAKLDNPISWIPQNSDSIVGQRYLLTLSEDLGAMAQKGSKVIAEVTAAEGDFLSMQVVEVNRQPIEHMDLRYESPEARTTPVAVIHYKQSPYLQAKLKGQGEGFGSKLLRAGLNVGIDQLRSSNVGDRASSLFNSLAPSRSGRSRSGLYHFDKEVEIYFVEGV